MEVLLDNICILCAEVTTVLTPQNGAPYMKYLYSTFFDKYKDALYEFQTSTTNGNMCILCSHQVVISHKFKDSYETTCKNSLPTKRNRTCCFICEQKGVELIEIDKNPNDFKVKISSFMDASVFPIPNEDCLVCFDCIFYLNVWYKIFSYIQQKCHIQLPDSSTLTTPNTRTKVQKKVHFNEDDTVIEVDGSVRKSSEKAIKDKESERKQTLRERSPPPSRTKLHLKNKPGPLSAKKKAGPLSIKKKIVSKRSKSLVKGTLKKQLRHLKSIKQINRRKQWSSEVSDNSKFYTEVPYVLLSLNQIKKSKARRKKRDQSKSPELIEISDSDDNTVKAQPTYTIKKSIGFKIKMSTKFFKPVGPKSRKERRKVGKRSYSCEICDKVYTSLSEYKVHTLWHEKPERVCINVTRSNFATLSKSTGGVATTDLKSVEKTEVESTNAEASITNSKEDEGSIPNNKEENTDGISDSKEDTISNDEGISNDKDNISKREESHEASTSNDNEENETSTNHCVPDDTEQNIPNDAEDNDQNHEHKIDNTAEGQNSVSVGEKFKEHSKNDDSQKNNEIGDKDDIEKKGDTEQIDKEEKGVTEQIDKEEKGVTEEADKQNNDNKINNENGNNQVESDIPNGTLEPNEKLQDFNSDSEHSNEGLTSAIDSLSKENGEIENDKENEIVDTNNDSDVLEENKKRISDDYNVSKSKRAKLSESEVSDTERDTAVET